MLHLLKGKKLVGYHILQKLKELKIDHLIEKTQPDGSESLIDVSGLFDESSQVRVPLDKLCESFLGLKYKRSKNKPHSFTECKVAMALYQKWKEIKGVAAKPLTVVDSNILV